MLKILGVIGGVVVIAIGIVLVVATTRPDTFHVERSAAIKAPPERVFAIINDFRHWPSWSPWQKHDPEMKQTVSGPASGKGAVSQWEGNSKVGAGHIEIVDAIPPSRITMKLDMVRPMEAHHIVEYTLKPEGNTTMVKWAMHGSQPFLVKIMSVFIDCDKMVGGDFEQGLENLKALAEK